MITPCDIIQRVSKTRKAYRVPRNKIPLFFYIDNNSENQLRNSHKNYLSEFANIEYNHKDIIFTSFSPMKI
jgi:hypothetical protein